MTDTLFAGVNQHNALRLLVSSAVMIGVAYASCFLPGGAPVWAGWLLAFGTTTIMISAMMLGAATRGTAHGRPRSAYTPGIPHQQPRGAVTPSPAHAQPRSATLLLLVFLVTWLIVFGGFAAALLLPPEMARDALWLGLPRRAAIIIYGIGLLPILLLPFAYARTFDDLTLSTTELQRVRDAATALRADSLAGAQPSERAP